MIQKANRTGGSRLIQNADNHALRRVVWVIGIVVLGVLFAYKFLPWSQERRTSPEVYEVGGQGDQQTRVAGERQGYAPGFLGSSSERRPQSYEGSGAIAPEHRQNQPAPDSGYAQQLMTKLVQIKPRNGKFSPEDIFEINRLIKELIRQGQAGVMAIRAFLESGQDVSYEGYKRSILGGNSSLRLAMIDALAQIGGLETAAFMASILQATTNPEEVALLAKGLERSAPGAYMDQILDTVLTMLGTALMNSPSQYPGLGYLFGVIQDYGNASHASDLESIFRKSPSATSEYAMMALSKLHEGSGISTLIKIANEMSGDPGAYGMRYDLSLQMLAQTSREYPEASEALLEMVKTNKIGTDSLIRVASVLGGTEHQLITTTSPVSQASLADIYINGRAAETWSDAEIDQRLRLIDQLIGSNPQPAAVKALENARNRLLIWKDRPMVGGTRQ